MADERRQNEIRRKINKLHHSRHLYETLQAKNYEQYVNKHIVFFSYIIFHRQMADLQKRRVELVTDIKRKDRRTKHFVKDKEEAMNLVRILSFI
jgi:hypothetical protein